MPNPSQEELIERLSRFASDREWEQFHDPKNLSMALVVEAGELVEIFQWLTSKQSVSIMEDPQNARAVRHELADVYAYLLRLANILNVDLNEALAEKVDINTKKYPVEKVKGSSQKYTEFPGSEDEVS